MFEECEKYTLDPFWKDIIIECSKGKFPKGVTYNSQRNTLRSPSLGIFEIPTNKKQCTALLINLFKSIGIKSPQDVQIERDNFEKEKDECSVMIDCEWKKIKPRNLREGLLLNYVCDIGEIFLLSDREKRLFYKFIQIGLFARLIDSDDIEYSDRKIKFIKGLNFDSVNRTFSFLEKKNSNKKLYKQTKKTIFCQKFNKYLKSLKEYNLKF